MNFAYDDEQTMLKQSLEGWLARHYSFEDKIKRARAPTQDGDAIWTEFAEMGWLSFGLPESLGGIDFGGFEWVIMGEAFGFHLVDEPFYSTAALGRAILRRCASDEQQARWLPPIAEGKLRLAPALAERASRFDLTLSALAARATPEGWRLNGEKIVVLDAKGADWLLVLARTAGVPGDKDGLSLFRVDPRAKGITMRGYSTVDDRRACDITFNDTIARDLIGPESAISSALDAACDEAIVYLCAESVGAMQALLETTLAYVKTRQQFGQSIGDFQSVRHKLADMRIAIEGARLTTLHAAANLDTGDRARAASAAKVQTASAGQLVGRNAIQLHGGMGMTDELAVGHYFKRLLMTETLLGDLVHHRRRFASLPSPLA